MKNLFFALVIFSILLSCSPGKQLMGDIKNKNFIAEIPFRYEDDMMLVDVTIDGSTFTFLFDTGAELNVIDQSVADKIISKKIRSTHVNGSSGTRKKTVSVVLPNFQMGDLEVEGSVAIVTEFSAISKYLGCLGIQGIIGNNVMHRANMQIDYKNHMILFSDQPKPFHPSEKAYQYKMNSGRSGNVKLKMTIGGLDKYLTFDTGYSGKIRVNDASILENNAHIKNVGITGASIHQVNKGISYYTFLNRATLANVPVENQVITVNENGSSLAGNQFLSNFTISVDWDQDVIFFDPSKPMKSDTLNPFELVFYPDYNTYKIEILKIMTDHTSFDETLLGWQVDKINGTDVTQFEGADLCSYWNEMEMIFKKVDIVDLHISNKGEEKNISVKRVQIDHSAH